MNKISRLETTITAILVIMMAISGAGLYAGIATTHAQSSSPTLTLSVSSGNPGLYSAVIGWVSYPTKVTVSGTGFPGNTVIYLAMIPTSKPVTAANAQVYNLVNMYTVAGFPAIKYWSLGSSSSSIETDADGQFTVTFYVPAVQKGTYNIVAYYQTSSGTYVLSTPQEFTVNPITAVINVWATYNTGSEVNSGVANTWVEILGSGFGESEPIEVIGAQNLFITSQVDFESGLPSSVTTLINPLSSIVTSPHGAFDYSTGTYVNPLTYGGQYTITFIGEDTGIESTTTFTVEPSILFYESPSSGIYHQVNSLVSGSGIAYLAGVNFPKNGYTPANSLSFDGVTVLIPSTLTSSSAQTNLPNGELVYETSSSPAATYSNYIPFTYSSSLSLGYQNDIVFNGTVYNFANGNIQPTYDVLSEENNIDMPPAGSLAVVPSTGSITMTDSQSYSVSSTIQVFLTGLNTYPVTSVSVSVGGSSIYSGPVYVDPNGVVMVVGSVPALNSSVQSVSSTISVTTGTSPSVTSASVQIKPTLVSFPVYFVHPGGASGATIKVSGFSSKETSTSFSVTVGTTPWEISSATYSSGVWTLTMDSFPNIAGGTYTVWINGTVPGDSVSTTVVVLPHVYSNAFAPTTASVGQNVILESGTTPTGLSGIHGLMPNTVYNITLDGQVVASFTSTASGQVPVGVQFTVPTTPYGYHIIDIVSNGKSAIYGTQGSGQQYGNLQIWVSLQLMATPTVGNVGTVVTLSGSGLMPNTQYYVQVQNPVTGVYYTYAKFTSTSSGAIPSGVSFTFPAMSINNPLGTKVPINIVSSSGVPVGQATFILQAAATLSNYTVTAGSTVTLYATGLTAGSVYNIAFNYRLTSSGVPQYTVVGALAANSLGNGMATFTVPAGTAPGTYTIQLVNGSGSSLTAWLNIPPVLTVTSVPVTGLTATTLTPGTPYQTTINGQPTVAISFVNTYSSQLTAIVFATVQNSAGQTVYITTATITPMSEQNVTAYLVLAGLPSGTYTVTLFAITPTGVAISPVATETVTV